MGKAACHVHDISHEGESSELIRELAAEEEEFGIRRIDRLKVVECNLVRDPFALNSCEYFRAEGMILALIILVRRRGPKFFHSEENRVVLVLIVTPAMVFVDSLNRYIRRVVLYQSKGR